MQRRRIVAQQFGPPGADQGAHGRRRGLPEVGEHEGPGGGTGIRFEAQRCEAECGKNPGGQSDSALAEAIGWIADCGDETAPLECVSGAVVVAGVAGADGVTAASPAGQVGKDAEGAEGECERTCPFMLGRIANGRGESSASLSSLRGAALTEIFSFGARKPEGTTRATGTANGGDAAIGACDSRGKGATGIGSGACCATAVGCD